ncbi:MAG: hypothetical protein HLUCCA11_17480 [Phormidesmis priestleyi Ana]|uniref:DUF7925 domain-containing protein n=1 Tax=Phormidesmis priestleyi Ana TaxID=1666911 RepID=A0A0P7ZLR2_9CYAN|nr:MAG: hypothetical protein HLUCCA11_17480 [Phormidesmis priestleyi Ana]
MVGAVLAEGTAAGTDISNTATATYNDGTSTFNTTSNTVIIQVAEIAGLTVVARPVEDADGGAIEAGDPLTYIFDVTNVGNAETDVFVPGIDNLRTENFTPSATDPVQVFAADGTTLIGTVPAGGGTIVGIGGTAIQPDASFVVKVTGTATDGTVAGESVSVTLGNTDDNPTVEGSDQTQNQSDNDDAGTNLDDLRTVNVGTEAPENGEREAQATGSGIYASAVRPLAMATVLKNASNYQAGVPSDPTDDRITYNLGLRVETTEPTGLFQPAALEGTTIQLNGSAQTRILISDAIPAQTQLSGVNTALPAGWSAVYSIDPAGSAVGSDPLALAWQTAVPADLSTVTRVGFVNNGPLGVGATATGLQFTVVTSGLPATGGTIENIAQVFGETVGDATNQIIYDESGDQNPNNYDDSGNPPATDGSDYSPGTDDGIAPETDTDGDNQPDDPSLVDTNNNNTGTGDGGEINVVSITPTTDDILNGTDGASNAVGPTGDNDDFTNQSTPVPAGLDPTATFDPDPIVFDNTLGNPATVGFIAETTIEPLSPSEAEAAGGVPGAYGTNADIPVGTVVTISDGVNTAVYTYDGTTFNTTDTPINVGDVVAGAQVNYTVEVDLPAGVLQLDEVAIPLVAFPDDDPAASPGYTGETTNNITINRVYTGFMSLVKEAQILAADGSIREAFTASPTLNAAPGEVIEYRLTYENISQAATGAGSVRLTANDFVILEDGTATPNNWADVTTHQAGASASAGVIRYFTLSGDTTPVATSPTDPADGTPAQKYENVVPSVTPGGTGTFLIRRVVD